MLHVGIDLGATKSHIVKMTSDGKEVGREIISTADLDVWLRQLEPSRVVMEACTQSPRVAQLAARHGHSVVVVPGNAVRALGVGARGIKTDYRDAEVLAKSSVRNEDLPNAHLRSQLSTEQRELLGTRQLLVKMRAQAALRIKSHLRGRFIRLRGRANSTAFSDAARSALVNHPEGLSKPFEQLLQTFEFMTAQIDSLQEQVESLTQSSEVCQRWMAIPGVGPQIALGFLSTLDVASRFEDSDHLASFLGLIPGESTTGGKVKRTGTIHAGPKILKSQLVQGAWSLLRTRPDEPMVLWARKIADKRGNRIAIVALARKLATVMWAMWKTGQRYAPMRASSVRAEPTVQATLPTKEGSKMKPISKTKKIPKTSAKQPRVEASFG